MMRRSCSKTIILAAAAILLSGLFLYIYATTNPESSRLFPKCIFLQLTGLRCPGCGSQRVVHSLLNGDIAAAFRYNAFLVLIIPYVSVLAFATFFKNRVPGLYNALCHPAVIVAILVLTILWWIFRNVIGW